MEIQASENLDMARFEALGVIKNDAVFDQFKLEFFSETIAVPVGILVRGVGDESLFCDDDSICKLHASFCLYRSRHWIVYLSSLNRRINQYPFYN